MIVGGDGENFLGALLLDDELVEIFFNDVGLIFFEQIAKLGGKIFFGLDGFLLGGVLVEVMIYLSNTFFADGEAGIGVVDGQVELRLGLDSASTEAATKLLIH